VATAPAILRTAMAGNPGTIALTSLNGRSFAAVGYARVLWGGLRC
jgi:hypothetical protein